ASPAHKPHRRSRSPISLRRAVARARSPAHGDERRGAREDAGAPGDPPRSPSRLRGAARAAAAHVVDAPAERRAGGEREAALPRVAPRPALGVGALSGPRRDPAHGHAPLRRRGLRRADGAVGAARGVAGQGGRGLRAGLPPSTLPRSVPRPLGREQIMLPEAVAKKLEVEAWTEVLVGPFDLAPPHDQNLPDWLGVVDSWAFTTADTLGSLTSTALEVLLETEAEVERAIREG